MYTNLFKNQENVSQRLNLTPICRSSNNFSKKKGQKSDNLHSYRGVGKKIYDFLYARRNLSFLQLKNSTIATAVGCDERTVQRWTSRMMRDGLLFKGQAHPFAVNEFSLNLTKHEEYEHYLNSLSEPQLTEKMYHGTIGGKDKSSTFLFETVTLSYSYINKYIYSTSRYLDQYARTREERSGFSPKQKERVVRGMSMLDQAQREWVSKHKTEPHMASVLMGDHLKPSIFTQSIEKVSELLELSERERLKLIAFPDEVMDEVCEYVVRVMAGKVRMSKPINDRVGWLLGLANNLCTRKQVKPEWHWYYDVCEILKIKPLEVVIEKRPLTIPAYVGKPANSFANHGGKSTMKEEKVNRTSPEYRRATEYKPDEKLVRINFDDQKVLEEQIAHLKMILEKPEQHYPALFLDSSVKRAQNTLKLHEERLQQLKYGTA